MTSTPADPAAPESAQPPSEPFAYTLWTVFRRPPTTAPAGPHGTPSRAPLAESVPALPAGATLRGIYDVSGLRADADLMFWLHGPTAEGLQAATRELRRSAEVAPLEPVWNAMGVHRTAEFARDHVPAFLQGAPALDWLTVYPFVRSYEWYVLPVEERRQMLAEHGRKGRVFRGNSNTVAAFALGDYEWILALEAREVVELVDLMRDLRTTEARRHVRLEVPFYTGRRIDAAEVSEVLR